jgi:hypothetical protein
VASYESGLPEFWCKKGFRLISVAGDCRSIESAWSCKIWLFNLKIII